MSGSSASGDPSFPRGGSDPVSHHSPALAEIFGGVDPEHPIRLLDLGPALPSNLDFYGGFTRGLRIAHLLRDLGPLDPSNDPDDESFVSRLGRLAPADNETFDLILAWDTLDYLTPSRTALLCHHLAAVASHGALLHAMTLSSGTMPSEPSSYEIVEPGRLVYHAGTDRQMDAPATPPAALERRVDPFRVSRSILLRHGVREFVGILD